jgi:hypothetical protein
MLRSPPAVLLLLATLVVVPVDRLSARQCLGGGLAAARRDAGRYRSRLALDRPIPNGMRVGRVLIAVVLMSALTGCGANSGASGSAGSRSDPAGAQTLPNPAALVLHQLDLGSGFAPIPNYARAETLDRELQHESPRARAADRRSFIAGYYAGFAKAGQMGVLSEALTYRSAADAATVSTDAQATAYGKAQLKAHLIPTPAGAPGEARFVMAGTLQGLPAYMYGWQHGAVLESVVIFGHHLTPAGLMVLAQKQDALLVNASS